MGEKNSFNMILYPYIYSRVIVAFRTMKDKPITKKVVLFPNLYQKMLWYGLFMLVDGMTWNRRPPLHCDERFPLSQCDEHFPFVINVHRKNINHCLKSKT